MQAKNIKSRERVKHQGEVFTEFREIVGMLDLIKNETKRIESRFFEPACGDGNFLDEILKRKLEIVFDTYKKNITDYEKYSLIAVSSIYGIDIMNDNIIECRRRLEQIWLEEFIRTTKKNPDGDLIKSIRYILHRNIINGDALTMKTVDNSRIIVSEWALILFTKIQRSDFYLDGLLNSPIKVKNVKNGKISYTDNKKELNNNNLEFLTKKIRSYKKLYDE